MVTGSIKLNPDRDFTRTIGRAPGGPPTVRFVMGGYAVACLVSMSLYSISPRATSSVIANSSRGLAILGAMGMLCFFVLKVISYRLTRRRNFSAWLAFVTPAVFVATGLVLAGIITSGQPSSHPILVMAWCLAGSYMIATSFAWRKRAKRMGPLSYRIAIATALAGWGAIIWGLIGIG